MKNFLKYLSIAIILIFTVTGLALYKAPSYLMSKHVANYAIKTVDPNSPWEVESAQFKVNWFSAQKILSLVVRHKYNNIKFSADSLEISLSLSQLIRFAFDHAKNFLNADNSDTIQLGPLPEFSVKLSDGKVITKEHLEKGTYLYCKNLVFDVVHPINSKHEINFQALLEGVYQGDKGFASIQANWSSPSSIFKVISSRSKMGLPQDNELDINIDINNFPIQFIRSLERNFKSYNGNKELNRALIKTIGKNLNAQVHLKLLNDQPSLKTTINTDFMSVDLNAKIDSNSHLVFDPTKSYIFVPWHLINTSISDPELYYIHPEARSKAYINIDKIIIPWNQGLALLEASVIDMSLELEPSRLELNNDKIFNISQAKLNIFKEAGQDRVLAKSSLMADYDNEDKLLHSGSLEFPTNRLSAMQWDFNLKGSIKKALYDFFALDISQGDIKIDSNGSVDNSKALGYFNITSPFFIADRVVWESNTEEMLIKAPEISLQIDQDILDSLSENTVIAPKGFLGTLNIEELKYQYATSQAIIKASALLDSPIFLKEYKNHTLSEAKIKIHSTNASELNLEGSMNIDSPLISDTHFKGAFNWLGNPIHSFNFNFTGNSQELEIAFNGSQYDKDLKINDASILYTPNTKSFNQWLSCGSEHCLKFDEIGSFSLRLKDLYIPSNLDKTKFTLNLEMSPIKLSREESSYVLHETKGKISFNGKENILECDLKGSHGNDYHAFNVYGKINTVDYKDLSTLIIKTHFSKDLYDVLPDNSYIKLIGHNGSVDINIKSSNIKNELARVYSSINASAGSISFDAILKDNWDLVNIDGKRSFSIDANLDALDLSNVLKDYHISIQAPLKFNAISDEILIPLDSNRWDQLACKMELRTNPMNFLIEKNKRLNINETIAYLSINTFYNPAFLEWSIKGNYEGEPFVIDLKSNMNNLTMKNDKLEWSDLKINSSIQVDHFPNDLLALKFENKDKKNLFHELTKDFSKLEIIQSASNGIIEVYGNYESDNLIANVPFKIDYPNVFLIDNIEAKANITSDFGKEFIKAYAPDLEGAFSFNHPIEFVVPKDSFALNLSDFKTLKIDKGYILIGRGEINNNKLLNSAFKLLDEVFDDYSERSEDHSIWLTPIYYKIENGKLSVERLDLLIDYEMPIAAWGTYDIGKDYLSFKFGIEGDYLALKLGKTPQSLKQKGYVPITYKGGLSDARLDTRQLKKAVSVLVGSRAIIKDDLIRNLISQVISMPFIKDIPKPTTKPFPWDKDTNYLNRRDQLKNRAIGLQNIENSTEQEEEKKPKFNVLDLIKKFK